MKISPSRLIVSALIGFAWAGPAATEDKLTLTSPEIPTGGALPDDLKCQRDNGDGASSPLAWTGVPTGTQSLALILYHYSKSTVEGVDPPSQYWLVWNIPVGTVALPRGNLDSLGNEGSDQDGKATGYTPPRSPKPWFSFAGGPQHEYFVALFALNAPLTTLPAHDGLSVDWTALNAAMNDKMIATSRISFWN